MKKRNFIVLIIFIFIILGVLIVSFDVFKQTPTTPPSDVAEDTNFFSTIFPFLKKNSGSDTNTDNSTDVSGYVPPTEGPVKDMILYKVSSMPVAGYGVFLKERFVEVPLKKDEEEEKTEIISGGSLFEEDAEEEEINTKPTAPETEKVLALRYVDKINGNIHQTFADKISESKFTNTVILNVEEAMFSRDGLHVIMRYLKSDGKTIVSYAGKLEKELLGADYISTTELTGDFLPENITDLSINALSSKMFYLFNNKDYTVGINASLSGEKKTQVFDSPYSEWLSQYVNESTITITTKAASDIPGFIYKINPNKKDFEKVLGPVAGLTTLTSPDGNLILYADDSLTLYLYNIITESTKKISIKTLPEKCAWNEDSTKIYCAMPRDITTEPLPDSWYQGVVSFSDQIWVIDAETLNTGLILDPLQTSNGEDIDGIKLTILDEYLFFVNKKDNFLWELKLK